ncbi:hypothetical protein [Phycicoccus sp. Soil802]|uniref:hypothetical protein n=1 Tax=Phycicoccus sp. Soil802 TaxID=1736414 RepID=UPI000703B4C0|nr:hypothetical protein [Phycicoccus sp. Soil802]KRF28348.1 hypothetical protein ASG91_07710 [Phycicoccus sp. Soil802]
MAIQQRMRVRFEDVFPEGVGMRGSVTAVEDFDLIQAAKAEGREPGDVRVRDKESGLRVWEVRVVDYDEEAPKNQGEVTVKIAADVQPVPPSKVEGQKLRPGGVREPDGHGVDRRPGKAAQDRLVAAGGRDARTWCQSERVDGCQGARVG